MLLVAVVGLVDVGAIATVLSVAVVGFVDVDVGAIATVLLVASAVGLVDVNANAAMLSVAGLVDVGGIDTMLSVAGLVDVGGIDTDDGNITTLPVVGSVDTPISMDDEDKTTKKRRKTKEK